VTTTLDRAEAPTLLLVDDAADLRRLLRTLVEADGRFRVVGEAGDGQEALEVAARCCPDAVLLDLAMPVMSGLDALPLLRSQCPHAAIVVHSSTPGSGVRRCAEAAGADGYVSKGSRLDTLIDRLEDVLVARGD
jgi:DNA-binding NarL/FixJ family response regulator